MKPTTLIQKHIENYDPKKPWHSFRGMAVGLIILSFVLSFMGVVNLESPQMAISLLVVFVLLAPFLYFILKGKIWSMISIMIAISMFTLLALAGGSYQGIIWNFAMIYLLFLSIQVERGRKKHS